MTAAHGLGRSARRVVLIGAESTGKTTLAMALTDRLRAREGAWGLTAWVPEYGRQFTIEKLAAARAAAIVEGRDPPAMEQLVWHTDDFVRIARTQRELEDEAARAGGLLLVCDTDAFATAIWHERYMHGRGADVEAFAADPDPDRRLYLLTDTDDIPFVQDGLRDGFAVRRWMTDTFVERMNARGYRWQWLRGTTVETRVDEAIRIISDVWPQ